KLARAALAYGQKEPIARIKSLIGSDTKPRAQLLAAEAYVAAGDHKAAVQVLDALKPPTAEQALLRARAAAGLNDDTMLEAALEEAQQLVAAHPLAQLMKAELRGRQGRNAEAGELAATVVVEPASLSLDASEEARAHSLIGEL